MESFKAQGKVNIKVDHCYNKPDDLIQYGFIKVRKLKKDVFFNPINTKFIGSNFDDIKLDDKVRIEYKKTSRGLLATQLKKVS